MSDVIQLVCEGQLVYLLVGSYDTSSYRSFVSAHEEKNSLRRLHPSSKKKKKNATKTWVHEGPAELCLLNTAARLTAVSAGRRRLRCSGKEILCSKLIPDESFLPGLPLGLPLVPERIMRDGRAINLIYLSRCVLDFRTLLNRATTNRG